MIIFSHKNIVVELKYRVCYYLKNIKERQTIVNRQVEDDL